MMSSSGSSTPTSSYYKIPPIITTEADREFIRDVNRFIDTELGEINHQDQEQRYLVFKDVFNKVIEHVTAYKPVLTSIQKEYTEIIDTIKMEQQKAAFLQGKLKAMACEPSTLRNYKKRADELEERRVVIIKKDNERLQKELSEIQAAKQEKEKRPQNVETPKWQPKKDTRPIPGLTLDQTTDMKVLQKKYQTLDRQLKEINNSLKTRYLPKTNKVKLKETLDNKVIYRDQLLWQSQMYKARGQKLKLALEAALAYNQVKSPHQTVGDAVTLAFQQASGMLKAERDKAEGEQDVTQAASLNDDDPEMEQEAEMMLEYIEKFNELFEDGLYEEAAVHAANSPKRILRTQATLAKFRDVKTKYKGRSPLLAFCDVLMSTVKAAGGKPNEALSRDCVEASLNENRSDLVFHWLAQDRLTISYQLGKLITDHCSCPIPCMCGCQAMAESVFLQLKAHEDVIFAMLKQDKAQSALQHARVYNCITSENVQDVLSLNICQDFVNGLMEGDISGKKPYLNLTVGKILLSLACLNKPELATNLVCDMMKPAAKDNNSRSILVSLQRVVTLDRVTTQEQWLTIMHFLEASGQQDISLQLLALTTVLDVITRACSIVQEDKKGVSFSLQVQTCSDSDKDNDSAESSFEMSSRSAESSEMSPDAISSQSSPRQSILKKRSPPGSDQILDVSDVCSRQFLSPGQMKKVTQENEIKSPPSESYVMGTESNDQKESGELKRPVPKGWVGIRFMDNDPYTSNPESADESEAD